MRLAAIIAEYNPFHNGHRLHIEETRRQFGVTHVVSIMSGSFVQRGDCACIDKFSRTRMALQCGADLVVELPLPWAMAGAETFARGGVGIAAGLGCVDLLSFGSESGDIPAILRTAQMLDDDICRSRLKELMSLGSSYPAALSQAISECAPECAALVNSPNDTLGIEYCRAISRYAPDITPCCIRRVGEGHDSISVESSPNNNLPVSASYIRQLISRIFAGEIPSDALYSHIPSEAVGILRDSLSCGLAPADISRLDRALVMKLRSFSLDQIRQLPDVSEGLEHRIVRCSAELCGNDFGFLALCNAIKNRRFTHARLRRIVLSALLGVTAADSIGLPPYIRVLGMNSRGKEILAASSVRSDGSMPILTRYSQLEEMSPRARRIFDLESSATDIFGLALPSPAPANLDLSSKLIVL